MSKYPISILRYPRAEVFANVQQGIMGIKSTEHWDVCNDLHNLGMDMEAIAFKYTMSVENIKKIRRCKCP